MATGAAGVVEHALLWRLHDVEIVCLVHRRVVAGPRVTAVRGDVTTEIGLTFEPMTHRTYKEFVNRHEQYSHATATIDGDGRRSTPVS